MRYAESFNNHLGHAHEAIADECRHAAVDFMAGVADGWTKFDLALWLHGPYALASRHAPRGERAPVSGIRKSATPSLTEPSIEQLLVTTRGRILAALELSALVGDAPDFIEDAIIEQHVRRTHDVNGKSTWIPVDIARMRLKDRVASLFVADYLNRPLDYERGLFVCHLCESVTFDAVAKESGRCHAHRVSSINLKTGSGASRLVNAV